jgi:aminodeoxyfutalosine synthase
MNGMPDISFSDHNLLPIRDKILHGQRLDAADGCTLFHSKDLIGKARLADFIRRKRHGKTAYFVYNQHINYTNICKNHCLFCAFSREKEEGGAFTLSIEDVKAQLGSRADEPITEIHMVGGLNASLPFDYYINLIETVKELRPDAAVKAFTAVEIDYFSEISGLSVSEVIVQLKKAGLAMMPGGGAEVLNQRVRQQLFPRKIGKERWLEIVKTVHENGLTSNATMLYGHIETIGERVDHLISLRNLQDETGGFSAFIPLAFHSENTKLSHLPRTTAFDDLTTIAVARLMLDNFDHIKAYWVMIGEPLAQLALSFGADDLDGTIIEEKITHMAGARTAKGLSRDEMLNLIRSAGFEPVERDSFYNHIENVL